MIGCKGLTLIELLLVVAVLGIAIGLAHAGIGGVHARNQLRAHANELMALAQQARTEALSRSGHAQLAPTERDGRRWGSVIQLRFAPSADMQGAELMFQMDTAPAVTIDSSRTAALRFDPAGAAGGRNQRIRLCHAQLGTGYEIVISNAGRARLARDVACSG